MSQFSDAYKKHLAQSGGVSLTSAPKPDFSGLAGLKPAPGGQDFLSWLTDILSRPLYSVTNTVNQGFNEIQKAADNRNAGKPTDVMGGLGNIFTAPARGFFSDNPADKATTSQLIEKGTDAFGTANDPGYTNSQDNVNPWVKGPLGLVGDIGLDPTTYLGGAGIIKKLGELGAKGAQAIRGGGDAAKAVEGVAKAAPTYDKAGNLIGERFPIQDTSKIPSPLPTATDIQPGLANRLTGPQIDSPLSKQLASIPPVEHPNAYVPSKLIESLSHTDTAKGLIKQLRSPSVIEAAARATTDFTKPLPAGRWLQEFVKIKPEAQITPNFKLGELVNDPGLAMIPENKAALESIYKGYTDGFARVQAQGKYLHPTGKVTAVPKPPAQKALNTLEADSAMTRFARMRSTQQGADRIESIFGTGVTDRLRRKLSPARFDDYLQHMNDVLDGSFDLNTVTDAGQLTDGGAGILKALGVDPVALNTARANRLVQPSRVREVTDLQLQAKVEKATTGKDGIAQSTLDSMKNPELTPAQQDVLNAVPDVWQKHFTERYATQTSGGVERTSTQRGYGIGKRRNIFNQYAQMTMRKKLTDPVFAKLKSFRGSPKRRAELAQAESMDRMRLSDEMAAHFGVPLYIGVSGTDALPLSLHQAYSMLDSVDHEAVLKMLWNQKTAVPDTNIADAINIAYRGGSHQEIVDAIVSNTRRNVTDKGKTFHYPNRLVDQPGDLTFGYRGNIGVGQKAPKGARLVKDGTKGHYVKWDARHLAEQYAATIEGAMPKIKQAVSMNAEDYASRLTTEASHLTEGSMAQIEALYQNPEVFSEAIHSIADAPKDIASTATAAHATQDATDLATGQVEAHIDVSVSAPAEAAVASERISKNAKPFGNTGRFVEAKRFNDTKKPVNEMLNLTGDDWSAQAKMAEAEAAANGDTAAQAELALKQKIPTLDVSEDVGMRVDQGVHRMLDGLRRMFDARFGSARVFDVTHGYQVLADGRAEAVGRAIAKLGNDFGHLVEGTNTTVLQKAWNDWRQGVRGTDPTINAAVDRIESMWGKQWVGDGAIVNNHFFRNSASLDAVVASMETAGLDTTKYFFDVERAAADAATSGKSVLEEAMKQVREWEVTDPVDFMHRMFVASERVATKMSVASNFVWHFAKQGLVSTTPRDGMVQIVASGKNSFTDFLPDGIYVDKSLAHEWATFDHQMSLSRTPDGELGVFVKKYFDPMQRAWKYAITLPRPGHHIRNLIGDASMTFVARGIRFQRRSVKDTFKLLSMSRGYDGVDLNRVMAHIGVDAFPKGSEIISEGLFGKVTYQEMLDAAFRSGMFPSFTRLEDLIGVEATSGLQNVMDKLTLRGGKIENALGTVSEYRDHFSRLQHFVQAVHQLQKGGLQGAKSMDDVYLEAAREVRKFHPDGSSLTPFEAKYMRRVIPFYTWFRGVLPSIITSTMIHPGRVLAFPKSSYNLAVTMGVNPDSLSNPFPQDQVFPSFLTEQSTGPQFDLGGRYVGFSPGIAHFDVANTLTDPIRGVAGMVTPILRVPAELLGGGQWGTGSRIKSVPDYIDANIPGVNYVANVSGTSPTGTLANLLQGKFQAQPQMGTTPNKNGVTNKDLFDRILSGFNWTTGLGAVDMSKPNYISYAQIEKRNNATAGG